MGLEWDCRQRLWGTTRPRQACNMSARSSVSQTSRLLVWCSRSWPGASWSGCSSCAGGATPPPSSWASGAATPPASVTMAAQKRFFYSSMLGEASLISSSLRAGICAQNSLMRLILVWWRELLRLLCAVVITVVQEVSDDTFASAKPLTDVR